MEKKTTTEEWTNSAVGLPLHKSDFLLLWQLKLSKNNAKETFPLSLSLSISIWSLVATLEYKFGQDLFTQGEHNEKECFVDLNSSIHFVI